MSQFLAVVGWWIYPMVLVLTNNLSHFAAIFDLTQHFWTYIEFGNFLACAPNYNELILNDSMHANMQPCYDCPRKYLSAPWLISVFKRMRSTVNETLFSLSMHHVSVTPNMESRTIFIVLDAPKTHWKEQMRFSSQQPPLILHIELIWLRQRE